MTTHMGMHGAKLNKDIRFQARCRVRQEMMHVRGDMGGAWKCKMLFYENVTECLSLTCRSSIGATAVCHCGHRKFAHGMDSGNGFGM